MHEDIPNKGDVVKVYDRESGEFLTGSPFTVIKVDRPKCWLEAQGSLMFDGKKKWRNEHRFRFSKFTFVIISTDKRVSRFKLKYGYTKEEVRAMTGMLYERIEELDRIKKLMGVIKRKLKRSML